MQRCKTKIRSVSLKKKGTGVPHLLVVHVAGASDERGPAFRVELQRGDAVPSVSLSRDLGSQNLQAVPGRKTCKNKVCDECIVHLYLFGRKRTSADICCSVLRRDRLWPSLWGWILLESFPWRGVPADLDADVPPSTGSQQGQKSFSLIWRRQ